MGLGRAVDFTTLLGRSAVEPSDLVRVAHVRAVSDGLGLICELPDKRRIGVPRHLIDPSSEVRHPGDEGTLVIPERLAKDLGLDGSS